MGNTQAQYTLRSRKRDTQIAWLQFTTNGASTPTASLTVDGHEIVDTIVRTSAGIWTITLDDRWTEVQVIGVQAEDTDLDVRYRADTVVDGLAADNTVRIRSETSQVLADTTAKPVHVTLGLTR